MLTSPSRCFTRHDPLQDSSNDNLQKLIGRNRYSFSELIALEHFIVTHAHWNIDCVFLQYRRSLSEKWLPTQNDPSDCAAESIPKEDIRVFLHNKRMIFTVRIDQPDAKFAKLLLEQFGGPNGELAAAMRYFTQGWAESDVKRRDMLLDIATEELSHLEMVGQTLVQLLRGTPSAEIDEVESGYLSKLLDGKHETFIEASLTSGQTVLGGPGPRLVDSMGNPWTASYIDTIGEPTADLRSDIAAEARAKLVYERLIKLCNDTSCRETLNFLMTREIAHQKMFEAALDAIAHNFPPGRLLGNEEFAHAYFNDSAETSARVSGFELVSPAKWGFKLKEAATNVGEEPPPLKPRPSVESKQAPNGNSVKS
jgi:Mn-containing catalase